MKKSDAMKMAKNVGFVAFALFAINTVINHAPASVQGLLGKVKTGV